MGKNSAAHSSPAFLHYTITIVLSLSSEGQVQDAVRQDENLPAGGHLPHHRQRLHHQVHPPHAQDRQGDPVLPQLHLRLVLRRARRLGGALHRLLRPPGQQDHRKAGKENWIFFCLNVVLHTLQITVLLSIYLHEDKLLNCQMSK